MIPGGDVLMFYQDYAHYISITSHSTIIVTDCHMNIMNLKSSCSSWWNHYLGTPSCLINQEKSGLTLLVVPTLWPTQQQNCLKNCVGWILITGMLQRQRFCTITESIHGIVCRQGRSTNKPTQNLRNLTPNPRHPRVVFLTTKPNQAAGDMSLVLILARWPTSKETRD